MARLVLAPKDVRKWIRGEILSRSRLTLQIYRKQRLERDRPNYPFGRQPGDGSIRDSSSHTIRPTARGARITVQSRGAPFIEGGNGPGAEIVAPMVIPLRRKRKPRGRIFLGDDGRAYLAVERVRTYKGQRLLEISARQAFGTRQIRRPPLH